MATWKKTGLLILGYVLLAIDGVFYFVFASLVVPAAALPFLWATWMAFAVLAIYWRRRPWRVVIVALAAFAVWFAILTLGDIFLGWTA